MQTSSRRIAFLIVALVVSGLILWQALPFLVNALPLEVRGRLPEPVLARLSTPLPTALPAPIRAAADSDRLIALPSPTATPPAASAVPLATVSTELAATLPARQTMTPTATATVLASPTPSPTAVLADSAMIDGLQIIGQKFNNCGPANLTMVLNYYERPSDQLDIAASIRPNPEDRNVSPEELVLYVNVETSLSDSVFRGGELRVLKRLLEAGYPVIVEKGLVPSERQGWMGHYLTLTGYDEVEGVFLALDSYLGPWDGSGRAVPYAEIDGLWAQFNRAFIVVHPPSQSLEVSRLLGPPFQDETAMWQAAADRARHDARVEPDNAFAWFNMGASLTHLGTLSGDFSFFEDAAVAFDRAREIGLPWRMLWYQFEPYQAYVAVGRFEDVLTLSRAIMSGGGWDVEETHLYHGHAQLGTGNIREAEDAYRRALSLNPNLKAAAEALEQLTAGQ